VGALDPRRLHKGGQRRGHRALVSTEPLCSPLQLVSSVRECTVLYLCSAALLPSVQYFSKEGVSTEGTVYGARCALRGPQHPPEARALEPFGAFLGQHWGCQLAKVGAHG